MVESNTQFRWLGANISIKLRFLRSKLKHWSINNNGDILKRKDCIKKRICWLDGEEETKILSAVEREERIDLKNHLQIILMQEEILWRQRSRSLWLKHGGRNTNFFHLLASSRKRKNTICQIKYKGTNRTTPVEIQEAFFDYFSELLGKEFKINLYIDWKSIFQDGPINLNDLEKLFLEEEIREAVFCIHRDEAGRIKMSSPHNIIPSN